MRSSWILRLVILGIVLALHVRRTDAQFRIEQRLTITGTIESVSQGIVVVKDENGKAHTVRFHTEDADGVALASGRLLHHPATVRVSGNYGPDSLEVGQIIRFEGRANRVGRTEGEIKSVELVSGKDEKQGITVVEASDRPADFSTCNIVGEFARLAKRRMVVRIPGSDPFTRKTALSFSVAEGAIVTFESDDLGRAGAGATVTRLVAVRLSTGDVVAETIEVAVSGGTMGRVSIDDQLLAKYGHLSDEPRTPRLIRSTHFAFMSDISDRQAQVILDKLETMVGLLTAYFGRGPTGAVEGFVVRDLNGWPNGLLTEPAGIAKIQEEAGVCFSMSLGNKRRAVLYSCDDHGVIQHECTHGFCTLAFGSTGPTWLAEGVAEMGNYWKAGQRAVDVDPIVISYLQQATPKRKLLEIAIPGRVNSGTWQDYTWRWALCHLLANNPNYAPRFKPLAIALMEKQPGVTFAAVYGPVAPQISFEYNLFLNAVGNGYRADLCAWQWNEKFMPLRGERRKEKKIQAAYGWQASGIQFEQGLSYDIAAVGEWKIAQDGSDYDADGDEDGRGQLVGILFNDFQLSDPFPIGKRKRLVAPADGLLFLRCQEDWNKLADNSGELTLHFRRTPPD